MKKLLLFIAVLCMVGCSQNQGHKSGSVSSSEIEVLAKFSDVSIKVKGQSFNASPSKVRVGIRPFNAVGGTVDIASIDPVLGTYGYETISNDSNETGVNIQFVKLDTDSEPNYSYHAFSAVDHSYVCDESKVDSDCETDMLTGYIWNQSIDMTEDNTTQSYLSIISSYLLDPNQTLEVGSSALKVVNGDGSSANGLSNISLGTDTNKCIYSSKNNEEDSDNFNIQFESCPVAITGYTKSNQKQTFSGSIQNVSIAMNDNDFEDVDVAKNDPRFTIERPLYSSTGNHIGYFRINMIDGGFSVVDLDKNPFTN